MTAEGLVGRGDAYAQAKRALQTVEWALERAGASMAHVVRAALIDREMLVEIEAEAYVPPKARGVEL